MINRPTLNCSHWWEFVYTYCCHDIICASLANFQRLNVIIVTVLVKCTRHSCTTLVQDNHLVTKIPFSTNERTFSLTVPFSLQTEVITSTIQHQVVCFNTSFDQVASEMHTWIDWIWGSWTFRTGTSSLQFNTFWETVVDLLLSRKSHYSTFILGPFGSFSFTMSYLPQRINYRSLMCLRHSTNWLRNFENVSCRVL